MKIIMTMKLTDRSVWNHVYPISTLKQVKRIMIVRDAPGFDIGKVCYVAPFVSWHLPPVFLAPFRLIQLIRLSSKEKPSLIHSFLLFPHGIIALLAGKITRNTTGISIIAGPIEIYSLGTPIGTHLYCYPLPRIGLYGKLILYLINRFDVITVTGNFTKQFLVENGINGNKISILPHSVDDRFRPMDIEKKYDIIFVGRLEPVKNVETIIRATSVIKETIPSIKVVIVGEGRDRTKLETLSNSLNLSDFIEFVGFQSNTWDWFNRGKISVVTSEREGFPYTVIESLKCGIPVISSNCGDVTDILQDSVNGVLIKDCKDYYAFADAIVHLLTNTDLIMKYSENAKKSVENITTDSVGECWESILAKIYDE